MEDYRFAGFRILEFASASKTALREIAERLGPHRRRILDAWVAQQLQAWQPPGFTAEMLEETFGFILNILLDRMLEGRPERCLAEMEKAGAALAKREFPYEALLMSLHFLEESYMPILLESETERAIPWLIGMDEFLHAVLAAIASSYFRSLRSALLEQVEVGRLLQEALLTDVPDEVSDLEVGYVYQSARAGAKVGGDFFDVIPIAGGGAGFIIADVSGSGLEAVSDSVMLRCLFRGFLGEGDGAELARVASRLNTVVLSEFKPDGFATAQLGVYDGSGGLLIINAGHPYPLLCRRQECEFVELDGLALGVRAGGSWPPRRLDLEYGDTYISYTDGLLEARSASGFFGEEGIAKAAREVIDASARGVAEHLLERAKQWAGGALSDDVAVLVLRRGRRPGGR
ncbi:MAG: PP2C family protein-serine/threonine phosphatase [Candidatus Geothermincolia bacterium]